VKAESGRRICTVRLRWVADVGGQVDAAGCRRALPRLADAARWEERGPDFALSDAIRRPVAQVVEDEAGYTLRLRDGRSFAFVALDQPPPPTATERTIGLWRFYQRRDVGPPRCRVRLAAGGGVTVGPACPRLLAGMTRWRASEAEVVLTGRATIRFRWGDAASIIASKADLAAVKD
jgi:hypothetical protein